MLRPTNLCTFLNKSEITKPPIYFPTFVCNTLLAFAQDSKSFPNLLVQLLGACYARVTNHLIQLF
eukprot:c29568_g1_i1 orf=2-193(-)